MSFYKNIFAGLLLSTMSSVVNAATISFDFTATVSFINTSELNSSSSLMGKTGSGHITYNTSPDLFGHFPAAGSSSYGFEVPLAEFTFELDGMVFVAGSVPFTPTTVTESDVVVDVRNDSPNGDMLVYWGNNITQTLEGFDTRMALVFVDATNTALTNSDLPLLAPNPELFGTTTRLEISISLSPGVSTSGLVLNLDSVTSTVVPVPAAVWLFGSGLLGLIGIARRKKA